MIKFIHKPVDTHYKNIVFYIESEKDIETLNFLKLDDTILKHIKK